MPVDESQYSTVLQPKDIFAAACRDGKVNRMQRIMKKIPPSEIEFFVNRCDAKGNTLLSMAAKHLDAVRVLLEAKGNPNKYLPTDETILHVACRTKDHGLIILLIQHGADVDLLDDNEDIPALCGNLVKKDRVKVQQSVRKALRIKEDREARERRLKTSNAPVLEDISATESRAEYEKQNALLGGMDPASRYGYLNMTDTSGNTPLMRYILWKDYRLVKLMLEYGADPTIQDTKHHTALHLASSCGLIEIAVALVQFGAQPSFVNHEGESCFDVLHESVNKARFERRLNAALNDLKVPTHEVIGHQTGKYAGKKKKMVSSEDALVRAVVTRHVDSVKRVLSPLTEQDAATYINSPIVGGNGGSVLLIASSIGHSNIVDTLLNSRGDPNVLDHDRNSPLHIACAKGYLPIVRALILHGGDVYAMNKESKSCVDMNGPVNRTQLVDVVNASLTELAANSNTSHKRTQLINDGDLLDVSDDMLYASKTGNLALLHKTLDASPLGDRERRVNQADTKGNTALIYASAAGHLPCVHSLLKYGARVEYSNSDKMTALHFAAGGGYIEIMRQLIACGARVNVQNHPHGSIPLQLFQHRIQMKQLTVKDTMYDRICALLQPTSLEQLEINEGQLQMEDERREHTDTNVSAAVHDLLQRTLSSKASLSNGPQTKDGLYISSHFKDFVGNVFHTESEKLHNSREAKSRHADMVIRSDHDLPDYVYRHERPFNRFGKHAENSSHLKGHTMNVTRARPMSVPTKMQHGLGRTSPPKSPKKSTPKNLLTATHTVVPTTKSAHGYHTVSYAEEARRWMALYGGHKDRSMPALNLPTDEDGPVKNIDLDNAQFRLMSADTKTKTTRNNVQGSTLKAARSLYMNQLHGATQEALVLKRTHDEERLGIFDANRPMTSPDAITARTRLSRSLSSSSFQNKEKLSPKKMSLTESMPFLTPYARYEVPQTAPTKQRPATVNSSVSTSSLRPSAGGGFKTLATSSSSPPLSVVIPQKATRTIQVKRLHASPSLSSTGVASVSRSQLPEYVVSSVPGRRTRTAPTNKSKVRKPVQMNYNHFGAGSDHLNSVSHHKTGLKHKKSNPKGVKLNNRSSRTAHSSSRANSISGWSSSSVLDEFGFAPSMLVMEPAQRDDQTASHLFTGNVPLMNSRISSPSKFAHVTRSPVRSPTLGKKVQRSKRTTVETPIQRFERLLKSKRESENK